MTFDTAHTSFATRRVRTKLIEVVDAGITVRTFRTADARTAELGTISMLNSIARWHHEGSEAAQVADDLVEMAVRIVQGDNLDHQPPTGRHVRECP